MARAMWKGSISFGLVNIPISLSVAVRDKGIHFHQVHDADGGRIREKRICEKDGKEVPYAHIAKGFEVSKGQTVVVTRDELKAMDPASDKSVSIEAFVDLEEIDPVFYERTYYVSPEGRGSAKAYALLAHALEKSGRVAIARIVLSTAQHMCVLRAVDGKLVLTTMVFGDEVEAKPDVTLPKTTAAELKLAETLIGQMTKKFDPDDYQDDHRERVLELLEQKAKGKTFEAEEAPHARKIADLKEALERSLAKPHRPAKEKAHHVH